MKSSQINFAPRSWHRSFLQIAPITWLLGVLGLISCAAALLMAASQMQENEKLVLNLNKLQQQLLVGRSIKPQAVQTIIPEAQVNAINAAVLQLNLPWSDLFDAMEAATPASIAVLAVEPDAKKHLIKGTAEAKNASEMIAYIERLKRQNFFARVALSKHETNEQDPNRPVRFQFEAQWKGLAE
jgi:Tfp pilus assembly protein PilN